MLVGIGDTLVEPVVLLGDGNGLAAAGDVDRTVVVARPCGMPQRIDISALLLRLERYGKHMGVLLQLCPHRLRQRKMIHARLQHLAVVF